MSEQAILYVVFSMQILVISVYLPSRLLARVREMIEQHPPADYPRLYNRPAAGVERALRNYRILNVIALAVGLVVLCAAILDPEAGLLRWNAGSAAAAYFLVQYMPLIAVMSAGFPYPGFKSGSDSRTTRAAALRPRRLLDFVPTTTIGGAVAVTVAFVALIVYVDRFDYPWFGGYGNLVGIAVLNLFLAAVIARSLYGKSKDAYQDHEDRLRQIGREVRYAIFVSIAATVFIALNIILRMWGFDALLPIKQSLYFQLLAVLAFRTMRPDDTNFEVYREAQALPDAR